NSDLLKGRTCDFNWLSISENGDIRVKGSNGKGYAWDGCTPKKNLFHLTLGTPDGKLYKFGEKDYHPYAYYASMIHDVIYQYRKCVPVTRKEADLIFYKLLKDRGFMWARVYYISVRLFGGRRNWKYKSAKQIEADMNNNS
ncbi:MAG: DUF1353 domain-containing protein, partial [Bacteroidetes bacterium]|nr:DUF1353 domain-containing protein [Bacteroidota bacterium]